MENHTLVNEELKNFLVNGKFKQKFIVTGAIGEYTAWQKEDVYVEILVKKLDDTLIEGGIIG